MKFAILGGTHGNEPVGIRVIETLKPESFKHSFQTFLANPKAYEMGVRFVDSDLNRAFGSDNSAIGNEKERAEYLKDKIIGNYDFLIDLHTTTSNMGITIILTSLNDISLKAAAYLKSKMDYLQIIVSGRAGSECPYTGSMCPSSITVEVGAVANNVINANLVLETKKIVDLLLSYDFSDSFDYKSIDCFRTIGIETYPDEGKWMVHPNVEGNDFKLIKSGDPIFIDIDGKELFYEGEEVYPLFINEAAYQKNKTAMEYAIKTNLDPEQIKLNLEMSK